MRINEIASAEEQIALWKLIATNVWTALDTQQRQQAQQNAVKKSRAKTTGHASAYKIPAKIPAPRAPVPLPQNKLQQQVQQNAQHPPSASAIAMSMSNQPKSPNTVRDTALAQRNAQTTPAPQDAKTALSVHNRGNYAKLLQLHNQHLQQRQA
jgi:hypothetical protein